jgi:RNA polymerase sigma-70 factor, ECF subfamily
MPGAKEFIHLLNQNQNIIHKVCNLYMEKISDREDLFQEITLQAWNAYSTFRNESKFSTWLYRVALNTAISFYRKEKRKPFIQSSAQIPEHEDETDHKEEQTQAMYKAIGVLSKIDKALIMLYLEDYNYEEIGNILGITANNVAVKMNRIRTKLKEESKKYYQFS